MLSESIVIALSTVTIVGWLLHLLFKHCYRKLAMRRLIWQFLEDQFFMEREYMEAHRAMIRRACQRNVEEELCNKN